ncbi:response regulator transcription factor [Limnochorda pilosa]|uniref:Chemotaxis protein CheY n=1 Tax=Limnochorda pilosa TaxID=1555112 RepID=A0A0K2SKL7_LIMPI|nr:response regulator transcription factor [Limnochorda pilosa]BAS27567.1 chemotaxis protein CheY [Limnochorda pilosa]
MAKILLVEDDRPLARLVEAYLVRAGHTVISALAGDEALALWKSEQPDLVVLDRMLPRVSGEEVCRRIREASEVPILMLTAKESEEDRVEGFRLGVDDYVVKPFLPRELVARVEALLRRARRDWLAPPRSPEIGAFRLDPAARRAWVDGRELELTPTEFRLLQVLLEHAGEAVGRRSLEQALFSGWADASALYVHVRHLRQKIEPDPAHPRYLKTVHGTGYRLDP